MPKSKNYTTEEYQKYTLDLLRKILDGVELNEIDFADHYRGEERLKFLRYCATVVENPFFEVLFSSLYSPHLIYAATKAENYDVVSFNRATANGIEFVKSYFKKYAAQYKEEFEKEEEKFDETRPFESVVDKEQFFRR